MKYVNGYKCTLCKSVYPKNYNQYTCEKCGEKGILDVLYDYEEMKKEVNKEYFKMNRERTILRYQPMMSIDYYCGPVLEVGDTPLYKSHHLARLINMNYLYIKDEGTNPTASLKDRASIVACLKAKEEGHKTVACSSTGNAATSLTGNAAKMGLKSLIFVPERVPEGKLAQLVAFGAYVVKVDGDYKATYQASKHAIEKHNLYNRNAAVNPHLVEGKKTVAYEIIEQLCFKPIDHVVVSVGDGCTIGAIYKGFYDMLQIGMIKKIPKIHGVQAEGCAPIYHAWKNNEPVKETEENTFADSIAVGIPRNPVKALDAVRKSNGTYVAVSDEIILDAMQLLGKKEGVFSEPAASAAFAGLLKLRNQGVIGRDDVTVVISTGNGLKDQKSILKQKLNIITVESKNFDNVHKSAFSAQIERILNEINEVKEYE